MRNQYKYDVPCRPLNAEEKTILEDVEKKSETKFNVIEVAYERHTPRATVCIIFQSKYWGLIVSHIIGVSIRSKTDTEAPEVGRLFAFRRALEDLVEWSKMQ